MPIIAMIEHIEPVIVVLYAAMHSQTFVFGQHREPLRHGRCNQRHIQGGFCAGVTAEKTAVLKRIQQRIAPDAHGRLGDAGIGHKMR